MILWISSPCMFEYIWAPLSTFEHLYTRLSIFEHLWAPLSTFERVWFNGVFVTFNEPVICKKRRTCTKFQHRNCGSEPIQNWWKWIATRTPPIISYSIVSSVIRLSQTHPFYVHIYNNKKKRMLPSIVWTYIELCIVEDSASNISARGRRPSFLRKVGFGLKIKVQKK